MQIVKKSQLVRVKPTSATTILEYPMDNPTINGAIAKINGRYPEKGYCYNEKSTELVYVLSGKGIIATRKKQFEFVAGDLILIKPNEQYYWRGNFQIFMANTPKFNSKQHIITKSDKIEL